VLAVGDAEFQKKCLGKMKDVSVGQGRTVLFVSHNMAAMLNLCSQAMLIENGSLKEIGKANNVISTYVKGDNAYKKNIILSDFQDLENKAMPYFKLKTFHFENDSNIGFIIEAKDNVRFHLIIEGEIYEVDNRFNMGYVLKNEYSENLIISFSTDQHEDSWVELKKGPISFKTTIDTSYLNEGRYSIYLLGSIHSEKMLFTEEDNIKLDFEIIGNRGQSPYWINRRNSSFAPLIKWEKK